MTQYSYSTGALVRTEHHMLGRIVRRSGSGYIVSIQGTDPIDPFLRGSGTGATELWLTPSQFEPEDCAYCQVIHANERTGCDPDNCCCICHEKEDCAYCQTVSPWLSYWNRDNCRCGN